MIDGGFSLSVFDFAVVIAWDSKNLLGVITIGCVELLVKELLHIGPFGIVGVGIFVDSKRVQDVARCCKGVVVIASEFGGGLDLFDRYLLRAVEFHNRVDDPLAGHDGVAGLTFGYAKSPAWLERDTVTNTDRLDPLAFTSSPPNRRQASLSKTKGTLRRVSASLLSVSSVRGCFSFVL